MPTRGGLKALGDGTDENSVAHADDADLAAVQVRVDFAMRARARQTDRVVSQGIDLADLQLAERLDVDDVAQDQAAVVSSRSVDLTSIRNLRIARECLELDARRFSELDSTRAVETLGIDIDLRGGMDGGVFPGLVRKRAPFLRAGDPVELSGVSVGRRADRTFSTVRGGGDADGRQRGA